MSGLQRRTPLKAGKPLARKTRIGATSSIVRPPRTPMPARTPARKPAAAAKERRPATGPTPETRELVLARDGHACVRCTGSLDAWFGYSLQHRIGRGAGGRSGDLADYLNSAPNLLTLCGSGTTGCHGWVEAHPAEADKFGWSVPSWADPATWPVYIAGKWFLLDTAGHLSLIMSDGLWTTADQYPGVRRLEERAA